MQGKPESRSSPFVLRISFGFLHSDFGFLTTMPVFRYQVIDARGRSLTGTMPAPDEKTLELDLKKAGLWLTEACIDNPTARVVAGGSKSNVKLSGKRGRRELIDFCTLMSYQLRAGVPLVKGLEVAGQDCKDRRFEKVLRGLRDL